jgi:hypothetical protein
MARGDLYILDPDGIPHRYDGGDVLMWSRATTAAPRLSETVQGLWIATDFVGFDLRKASDPPGSPLLWETLLFTLWGHHHGNVNIILERHSSMAAATQSHRELVSTVRKAFEPADLGWRFSYALIRSSGRCGVLGCTPSGWSWRGPTLDEPRADAVSDGSTSPR